MINSERRSSAASANVEAMAGDIVRLRTRIEQSEIGHGSSRTA